MKSRLLYCLAAMLIASFSPAAFAGEQIVQLTPAVQDATGSLIQLQASYDTSDARQATGLGLRVHYDSRQLSYQGVDDLLQDGLQPIGLPQPDSADFDNDPNTNTLIVFAWLDFQGNWPLSPLPTALFNINFTATDAFSGQTAVNLSASSTASGYTLQSNSARIE